MPAPEVSAMTSAGKPVAIETAATYALALRSSGAAMPAKSSAKST